MFHVELFLLPIGVRDPNDTQFIAIAKSGNSETNGVPVAIRWHKKEDIAVPVCCNSQLSYPIPMNGSEFQQTMLRTNILLFAIRQKGWCARFVLVRCLTLVSWHSVEGNDEETGSDDNDSKEEEEAAENDEQTDAAQSEQRANGLQQKRKFAERSMTTSAKKGANMY